MNFSDAHKTIMAVVAIAGLSVGGYKYFIPRSEAAQQIEAAKKEQAKSVAELRAELAMNRVGELNSKEAKEPLTPTEKTERELLLAQVKALQAEQVKK